MTGIQDLIDAMAVPTKLISGLHVYAQRPLTIDAPALVFGLNEITYDVAFSRGADEATFVLTVFTQSASDRGEAQLYSYLDANGDNSIKAALEDDETLGGVVQWCTVTHIRPPGLAVYGGANFYGCAMDVSIGATLGAPS